MYVWAQLPEQAQDSVTFTQLVETTGVAASPGAGFKSGEEGYVRLPWYMLQLSWKLG